MVPAQGRRAVCFVRALARVLPKSHDLPECMWPTGFPREEPSPDHRAAALLSAQSLDSDHTCATVQQCPWELGEAWAGIAICQERGKG